MLTTVPGVSPSGFDGTVTLSWIMITRVLVPVCTTRCSHSVPIPDSGTLVFGGTLSPIPGCPATDRPTNEDLSPNDGGLPDAVTSALTTVAVTRPPSRFRFWMAAVTSPDTLLAFAVPFAVSVTVPVARTPGIVTETAELASVLPCVPRHGIGC